MTWASVVLLSGLTIKLFVCFVVTFSDHGYVNFRKNTDRNHLNFDSR